MKRRLADEEKAIWAKVTATVTPLPGRRVMASDVVIHTPTAPTPPKPPLRKLAGPTKVAPSPAPAKAPSRIPTETLDGSWDKRLSSGKLQPDMVIDLHGHTRETARHILFNRIQTAEYLDMRVILVITGKGSQPGPSPADLMQGRPARGAIKADLPRWIGEEGLSSKIAAVRNAQPRHGGAGAVYLILKRRRTGS